MQTMEAHIRTNILYHTAPLASSLMDLGSDFKIAVSQCRQVVPLAQCDAELLRVVCTEISTTIDVFIYIAQQKICCCACAHTRTQFSQTVPMGVR